MSRSASTAASTWARPSFFGTPAAARSSSCAPSSSTSAVSIPAGSFTAACLRQVATGSDHASTRYDQRPGAVGVTYAPQRSLPSDSSCIGVHGPERPRGSRSTTLAPTASWPSRNTVAETRKRSPSTALAGRRPASTRGDTSSTGMRPITVSLSVVLRAGRAAARLAAGRAGGSVPVSAVVPVVLRVVFFRPGPADGPSAAVAATASATASAAADPAAAVPVDRTVVVRFAAALRGVPAARFTAGSAAFRRAAPMRGAGTGGSPADGVSGVWSVGTVDWSRVSPCMPMLLPEIGGSSRGAAPGECRRTTG